MEDTNTIQFLKCYLNLIGIREIAINTSQDEKLGNLIIIDVPKTSSNKSRIPMLLGKQGGNILSLRRLVRVVGKLEGLDPILILRLK